MCGIVGFSSHTQSACRPLVNGGAPDRETFVLNGTGENRLVLRVHAAPRRVQAFDTFGKEVPAPSLAVGVNEVPVPCSGYLRIAY